MKQFIMASVLTIAVSFCSLTANADSQHSLEAKGNWNPVTIYNNLNTSLDYSFGFATYSIKAGRSDVYHSKGGDAATKFTASRCLAYQDVVSYYTDANGNLSWYVTTICVQRQTLCNDQKTYNVDLMKSIQVFGVNACLVTCLDGSTTSCIVRN